MGTMMGIARLVQKGEPEEGIAPYEIGIAPFENLTIGKVLPLMRALRRYTEVKICKEIPVPIVHCLGVHPDFPDNGKIKVIYSKEEALQQCELYIDERYPRALLCPTLQTGDGVETILRENMRDAAVIASESNLRGLRIMAKNIVPGNVTRFAVLRKEFNDPAPEGKPNKTLLSIHPEQNEIGTLVGALAEFSGRNVNLEGVCEVADGVGGYHFYVEASGHLSESAVRDAIFAVGNGTILGCYEDTGWRYANKK
jgi:chorismate mutase/prephenate dehydratase